LILKPRSATSACANQTPAKESDARAGHDHVLNAAGTVDATLDGIVAPPGDFHPHCQNCDCGCGSTDGTAERLAR